MAQSQNSTVDLATPATCLMGLTSHGNVMVGNKAFEYYNERNPEDYIQIPWDEVDYIAICQAFGAHAHVSCIFLCRIDKLHMRQGDSNGIRIQ